MTKEQIEQAQATADDLGKRLCHLSDDIKQLYDAVSRVDAEADDLSYDAIHLQNMLEIIREQEEEVIK